MKTVTGIVISSEGGLYKVLTKSGEELFCKPRGLFRHQKIRLLSGDRVSLGEDEKGNRCIMEIGERKNALLRPPVANVDRLFIVCSAAKPETQTLNVDKLTTIAEQEKISLFLILTKTDLSSLRAGELSDIYEKAGYRTFAVSSVSGEGLDALRAFLSSECANGLSVFAGASGVGKSTLLNMLYPGLSRRTNSVSEKIGRGRHTTRTVDLIPTGSSDGAEGFIADTPGFTLLDFENFDFFDLEELPYNFKEFRNYIGTCRYTKCTHRKEEGCAIIEAVKNGLIPPSRHESYVYLYDQLKEKHRWDH